MWRIGRGISGTFIGTICCAILSGLLANLLSPIIQALVAASGSPVTPLPATAFIGIFIYGALIGVYFGPILGFMVGVLQIPSKLSAAIGGVMGLYLLCASIAFLPCVFSGAITGYAVAVLTQLELD